MQNIRDRYRKIIYLVLLAVLAIALFILGQPARVVKAGGDVRSAPGGTLAQYRSKKKLTEAQMGKIDPASNTIKLATFGMRGVAISLLWHQAQEQQKRHQWNDVVATANQITFIEPHFISTWSFLGWNLAYNASTDFDDYRERYRWVIRGIDFLVTGLEKNRRSPKLNKDTGWTVSQKIGIADEAEQYRRLLREDEEFGKKHDCELQSERDNWLLGRRWYHWGEELVLKEGISLGNESGFVYFANSRLNLFNYARWKRKDGIFGEEAIAAWQNAIKVWIEFSQLELDTAIPKDSKKFQVRKGDEVYRAKLETTDIVKAEEKELVEELNNIVPRLKGTLALERWNQLGETAGQQGSLLSILEKLDNLDKFEIKYYPIEEFQAIWNWLEENEPDWKARLADDLNSLIPEDQTELRKIPTLFLSDEERAMLKKTDGEIAQVRSRSVQMLRLEPKKLSEEIQELDVPLQQKNRAREIVEILNTHGARTQHSNIFRDIVGYDARFREVAVETSEQADDAHRLRYEARKDYYDGKLAEALTGWLAAMRKWDELLDLDEFKDRSTDNDFVRDRVDLAEKILIIFDDSNKIFSDVSGDPVPLHRIMWSHVFRPEDTVSATLAALDYTKREYEQALAETDATKRRDGLEKAEEHFSALTQAFRDMNYRAKFMDYAPFFKLRDGILESVALYIKSLEAQGKPLPEPLILRSYVELMLKHDPAVSVANEILINTAPLIQEAKYEEAQSRLDEAIATWQVILEKYPIIAHDTTNSAHADVVRLTRLYADVLRTQEKPIPEDFPLNGFLQ